MIYNKQPIEIGVHYADVQETFDYLYLPIKLMGQSRLTVEPRLNPVAAIVGAACGDYIGRDGLDNFVGSYVYLTAKNQYQPPGVSFNRPGWHADGFGSDDISYIWSDKQPTVFNSGDFWLSDDDTLSMQEMQEQADPGNDYQFANGTLLRMDQFTIHRVAEPSEGVRCFVKVVFSKDQFKLRGNSVNHELDYSWEYSDRKPGRNIPQGSLLHQQ